MYNNNCIQSGHRFGKLIVVKVAEYRNDQTYWLCACDCGQRESVEGGDLRKGRVNACRGCA